MKKIILCVLAAGLLCGCGYDPAEIPPVYTSGSLISTTIYSSTSAETSSTATAQSSSTATSSSTSTSNASDSTSTTSYDYSELPYIRQSLTSEEKAFAEKSLFIGDSICRGFEAYDVLSANNVMGVGNVGTRNIFATEFFRRGKDVDFLTVIENEKPSHVVFSMGMNDVNMTSASTFCENYGKVIDAALTKAVDDVYVLSLTPICSDFTDKNRIISFNESLCNFIISNYPERVHFVNIHDSLTDKNGEMCWFYSSGDGVHINELAYYRVLNVFFSKVDLSERPVSSSTETSSSTDNSSTSENTSEIF